MERERERERDLERAHLFSVKGWVTGRSRLVGMASTYQPGRSKQAVYNIWVRTGFLAGSNREEVRKAKKKNRFVKSKTKQKHERMDSSSSSSSSSLYHDKVKKSRKGVYSSSSNNNDDDDLQSNTSSYLANALDEYAQDMLQSLQQSDKAINSAATRVRYDPGVREAAKQVDLELGKAMRDEKKKLVVEVPKVKTNGTQQKDNDSPDSFLRALEDDDEVLLRKWREKNKSQAAKFYSTFSDSEVGESNNDDSYVSSLSKRSTRSVKSSGSKAKSKKKVRGRSLKSTGKKTKKRTASMNSSNTLKSGSSTARRRTPRRGLANRSRNETRSKTPRAGSRLRSKTPKKNEAIALRKRREMNDLSTKVIELSKSQSELRKVNQVLRKELKECKRLRSLAEKREKVALNKLGKQERIVLKLRQDVAHYKSQLRSSTTTTEKEKVPKLRKELERLRAQNAKCVEDLGVARATIKTLNGKLDKARCLAARKRLSNRTFKKEERPPIVTDEFLANLSDESDDSGGYYNLRRSGSSAGSGTERRRYLNMSSSSEPLRTQNAYQQYQRLKSLYTERYS